MDNISDTTEIEDHLREMGFEPRNSKTWFRKNLAVCLRSDGVHEMIFTPIPHKDPVIKASFTNEPKSLYLALTQVRTKADEWFIEFQKWFIEFQKELRSNLLLAGKDVPEHLFEENSRE